MVKLLIKGISSVIPGHSDTDNGQLISTEEILTNIQRGITDTEVAKTFNPSFVKNMLGIDSVAVTNCSANFARKYWLLETEKSGSELFSASQSATNISLFKMLEKAISQSLGHLEKKETKVATDKIVAHIHISALFSTIMETEFVRIRQSFGIGANSPFQTLFLQQGCSGLLGALNFAKAILAGHPSGSNILITADNNMLITAHQRCRKIATVENINKWLWPAIFGEGVGALVVGSPNLDDNLQNSNSVYFSINSFESEIIENEWRVAYQLRPEENSSELVIKAKEVKSTYGRGISKNTINAIEKSGGLDRLYKVCLHESNPKLILEMSQKLNIPLDMIPTISAKVGTLACVSAFSLLDIAINSYPQHLDSSENAHIRNNIVVSLIGEAGGIVTAGHICLSAGKNLI